MFYIVSLHIRISISIDVMRVDSFENLPLDALHASTQRQTQRNTRCSREKCWQKCSPHDRLASVVGVVEELVPVGQQGVALSHGFTDQCCVLRTKEPWLTPRRVQVSVGPEERLIGTSLIPAHQQLRIGRFEEAPDISWVIEERTNRGKNEQ